ncbi:hypothetical protein GCM10012287_19590 [Streptomyces daqingensis]|uniref:Uncharacterized protein n=1 Tax=Streptomyces daqingensis TaxID=1472640 RepID=A0ABQ2M624_9ACTN|nr:hypothetical protein GCM10012287_19590 [Streptomyces daqingensis]
MLGGNPWGVRARVQQHRVQPFVTGGRAGVEQADAGEQQLPGAAGAAAIADGGGGDTVLAQFAKAHHPPLRGFAEVAERARGKRGVVRHAGAIPTLAPPSNLCYEAVDKAGQLCPKVRTFESRPE